MAIIELEKAKKYKIVVPISYDGNKRHCATKTIYCGKKEAQIQEAELKAKIKNGTYIEKTNITFKELLNEWTNFKKNKWSPKTYQSNIHWCEVIIDNIGHVKLSNLNIKTLENFYDKLKNEIKYSDKTIQHFYTLISGALNKAIDWEYLEKNPNSKIEKPKVKYKEKNFYNKEEVQELLSALENESLKYRTLITLALDSGARRGEITGLTWNDIDFEHSSININKSTQYTADLGIFEKSPKSNSSNRKIYISKTTLNLLKKYQKQQLEKKLKLGNMWGNSQRVFTTEFGKDMHPDTPSQIFKKIIKKHNLKKICFHELRHTSISLQISLGIPLQQISRRAGHSNVTITDNVYSHIFENDKIEISNKIDNFIKEKVI